MELGIGNWELRLDPDKSGFRKLNKLGDLTGLSFRAERGIPSVLGTWSNRVPLVSPHPLRWGLLRPDESELAMTVVAALFAHSTVQPIND